MMDVIAIGELLIDFTESGYSEQNHPLYEANPGGAPCNMLAMLASAGHSVGFIGKVGDDLYGRQLQNAIKDADIDASHLSIDPEVHTTLAFVETRENGDRDFTFYRNPGADMSLTEADIDEDYIKQAKILHYGTLSMTHEGCRKATQKAIRIAKENDLLCSFDPNLRPPLWSSMELAKEQVLYGLSQCDILKIADNELAWLTGDADYDAGIHWIHTQFPKIQLILLTLGSKGSRAYYKDIVQEVPSYSVQAIDTTGAGDTFMGGALHVLLSKDMNHLSQQDLEDMLQVGNAVAACIVTKKGALSVMPTLEDIYQMMNN